MKIIKFFRGWAVNLSGHSMPVIFSLATLLFAFTSAKGQSADEQAVNAVYRNLIKAEDSHDIEGVKKLIWVSPDALFVAKTKTREEGGWAGFWGTETALQHIYDIITGNTFHLDPDYSSLKTVLLKPDVAETYVPVKISVSYAGQTPVPKPFLMMVMWVKIESEWKMATDIAIPIPQ